MKKLEINKICAICGVLLIAFITALFNNTILAVDETVNTYEELINAINAKKEKIVLGANIEVKDTIIINYDCNFTTNNNSGLIRANSFKEIILLIDNEANVTIENIVIDGKNIEECDSAVHVKNGTTLKLKNTTIKNNIADHSKFCPYSEFGLGGAIYNAGILEMYDGTVIDKNSADYGGGVYINNNYIWTSSTDNLKPAKFYMYGGTISNNTANGEDHSGAGGGVKVDGVEAEDVVFYMYGGKIIGNNTTYNYGGGGGVALTCYNKGYDEGGTSFYMYDGEISDNNSSARGGGVFLGCSAMVMEGGIITRNTAESDGGGIGACCSCAKFLNMTGGIITLNYAGNCGGGIGPDAEGKILAENIYDNLAETEGDDIAFNYSEAETPLTNSFPTRKYGESYASNVELQDIMKNKISTAKPTVVVDLIDDVPEPIGVEVPFLGWFTDSEFERYTAIDGEKDSLENEQINMIQEKNAKAIWYGVVLLYDANYEGGKQEYSKKAYIPGDQAKVSKRYMRDGYIFTGWNTESDGSGTTYNKGDVLKIQKSTVLYAQWVEGVDTYEGELEEEETIIVEPKKNDPIIQPEKNEPIVQPEKEKNETLDIEKMPQTGKTIQQVLIYIYIVIALAIAGITILAVTSKKKK